MATNNNNPITEGQLFSNFRIPLTNNRLVPGVLASYGVNDRRALGRLLRSRVTGRNNLLALPPGPNRNDILITRQPVNSLRRHQQAIIIQRRMRGVHEASIRRQRAQAVARGQANSQKRKREAERSVALKRARVDAVRPLQRVVRRSLKDHRLKTRAAKMLQRMVRNSQTTSLQFVGTDRRAYQQYGVIEQNFVVNANRFLDDPRELSALIMNRVNDSNTHVTHPMMRIIIQTDNGSYASTKYQRYEDLDYHVGVLCESIWYPGTDGSSVTDVQILYMDTPSGGAMTENPFVDGAPRGLHVILNEDDLCGQRALAISTLTNQQYADYNRGKRSIKKELKAVCDIVGDQRMKLEDFEKYPTRVFILDKDLTEARVTNGIIDDEHPPVYLYFDWVNGHYHLIRNINAFCNNDNAANLSKYKWCDDCVERKLTETFAFHKCKGLKCKQCYTKFATQDDLDKHDDWENRNDWEWLKCHTCNWKMHSEPCYEKHVATCKSKNWRCDECLKWVPKDKWDTHVCGEIVCETCNEAYMPSDNPNLHHACYLSKPKDCERDFVGTLYAYDFEALFQPSTVKVTKDKLKITKAADKHVINLAIVKDVENDDPKYKGLEFKNIEGCVKWMLEQKNATFVAHNARSYDLWLIHNYIINNTNIPHIKQIVFNGAKIMYMQIRSLRWLDSLNHFSCALSELPNTFGFSDTVKKGLYPYKFNTLENESYVGPMPAKHLFEPGRMKVGEAQEFHDWYDDKVKKNYVWNNWTELKNYCIADVDVLRKAIKIYRESGIEMTTLDPWRFVTTAGYCIANYKRNHMPAKSMGVLTPETHAYIKNAFFGGRTNALKLHKEWTEEEVKSGVYGSYMDVQSLYPAVQFDDVIPAGKSMKVDKTTMGDDYEVVLEQLIEQRWDKDWGIGFYRVDIEPPKDLFHPVLPERKNGKLIFDLVEKKDYTATSIELKKALQKGYKVTKWYDAVVYEFARNDLFKSYVAENLKTKVAASGIKKAGDDVEGFIQEHRDRFGFELNRDEMVVNPGLRANAKSFLVNLWGKLGEDPDKTKHEYVKSPKRFYQLVSQNNRGQIKDLDSVTMSSECMRMSFKEGKPEKTSLAKTNLAVAAFVTAHGRLRLYTELEKLGDRVLYYDSDSIIYEHRPNEYNIPKGKYLGEWEDELNGGKIIKFVSLGPKSYSYVQTQIDLEDQSRDNLEVCKNKGFTLNVDNSKAINYNKMKKLLDQEVEQLDTKVLNFKKCADGITSYEQTKTQRFTYNKCHIQPNRCDTLPFGHINCAC